MKNERLRIHGIFADLYSFTQGIRSLRQAGYTVLTALSPVPRHEIDAALEAKKSPVRFFTFAGGVLGGLGGLVLTIATSLHYPLITSGKPIVSIVPFLVIVFELTILFGALATILGMLINIRLPRFRLEPGYDPRFTEDRFNLWVTCKADEAQHVQDLLRLAGAEEVRHAGD